MFKYKYSKLWFYFFWKNFKKISQIALKNYRIIEHRDRIIEHRDGKYFIQFKSNTTGKYYYCIPEYLGKFSRELNKPFDSIEKAKEVIFNVRCEIAREINIDRLNDIFENKAVEKAVYVPPKEKR